MLNVAASAPAAVGSNVTVTVQPPTGTGPTTQVVVLVNDAVEAALIPAIAELTKFNVPGPALVNVTTCVAAGPAGTARAAKPKAAAETAASGTAVAAARLTGAENVAQVWISGPGTLPEHRLLDVPQCVDTVSTDVVRDGEPATTVVDDGVVGLRSAEPCGVDARARRCCVDATGDVDGAWVDGSISHGRLQLLQVVGEHGPTS